MDVEIQDLDYAPILHGVTLAARSGEVHGIVGPNGSGKSTALRCVYRALKPSAGRVLLDGEERGDIARHLAALIQDSSLEFDFTAAEVVATGRLPHQRGFARESAHDRRVVETALSDVDAAHLADRGFLTLSGGERQRVLIARALAQQPRVLVLDEPTNHLDIHHQLAVLRLVRGLGVTVLAVLHDLNLAAAHCDRVHVLARGRVVASGTPADVLTPDLVADVFGVRAHVVRHPVSGAPQLLFDLQEETP
ncbi:ABC transporter ATP-binding protein [Saccharothrix coeruleofusca]|uniref:ABC transporter ATP-binding protein n=1 Tax=Saccharothrix coeruleofusca TaxID=33919 RepID=A0A918AIN0_9PSEU|nr:ABC transporter ATP-binding protein [Saccharothrix coeruleofusca]MBP2338623.1 iron complex transport system ATP-binding protein [Saccharothrix coeruleofusca]GGP47120.1 ABC transporter ATP-binding protein [Saccharothrix coeruleofusca]